MSETQHGFVNQLHHEQHPSTTGSTTTPFPIAHSLPG